MIEIKAIAIMNMARIARIASLAAFLSLPASRRADAQYRDPFPSYTGHNLILEGSSFETGFDNFGYWRKLYYQTHRTDGFSFVPLAFDSRPGYAVHGKRSLEIVNETEDQVAVDFHWIPLEIGTSYVVSFWAKAEKSAGQPSGEIPVVAKVLTVMSGGVQQTLHQQSFSLDETWRRFSTKPFAIRPAMTSRPRPLPQLSYLQFFTGPWYSRQPPDSAARLHGTIWLDGVQLAASSFGTSYEYPPDETIEIGAWTSDATGIRTGNLFHVTDATITACVRLFSEEFVGEVRLDYDIRDSLGTSIHSGSISGIYLSGVAVSGSEADVTLPLRDPTGGDLLEGRRGVYRVDFQVIEPNSESDLGHEELLLCVTEPVTGGTPEDCPFGTHVHFKGEASRGGFNTNLGTHDHIVVTSWPQDYLFRAIRDAGFRWVRDFHFASWAAVQPTPNDWITCDHTLDYCEKYGLRLLPILGWVSPDWADTGIAGHPFVDWQSPRDLVDTQAWTAFVSGIAGQYQGRINAWEVCNEPYFYYSVAEYHDLFLEPAHDAVQQLSGTIPQVIGPAGGIPWMRDDDCTSGNFIDQLFCVQSGGVQLDILTDHFYVKKEPPFEPSFHPGMQVRLGERIGEYITDYKGSNAPGDNTVAALWDGESGQVLPTLRSDCRVYAIDYRHAPYNERGFLNEMSGDFRLSTLIASYLVRAYVVELASGAERFFQHTFFGEGTPIDAGGQRLLEWDGTPTHAYAALAALALQMQETDHHQVHPIEDPPAFPSVRAYTFLEGNAGVAVLWDYQEDDDFATLQVSLSPAYLIARDLMGNEIALQPDGSGGILLPLHNWPVYLRSDGVIIDYAALIKALDDAVGL